MGASAQRFGVEEEYLILNPETGQPENRATKLIHMAPHVRDRADREFFECQLETATPVCEDLSEATESLNSFRREMMAAAREDGVLLAGVGMPPAGGEVAGLITAKRRYREIKAATRQVSRQKYVTGTHVHVEIPSRDAGVEVLARMTRWVPVLLALTANSPIWAEHPTGFASWRHVHDLSWPVSGYPPALADAADYDRVLERLVQSGIIRDSGLVNWSARLSSDYPTVELRIADAQLSASDAVSFAGIVRALVRHEIAEFEAGVPRVDIYPALVSGATWLAARDGLLGDLVDPLTGVSQPAFNVVDMLVERIEEELNDARDYDRVTRYIAELRRDGGPAAQQVKAYETDGMLGLLELFRSRFVAEDE
ncbi:carboxylate-amine ligase [Gulosibacter molinativorax]|uniref:Putative glutamate--cysteine ligase 2 n=1 Tax=Gulosibacter molinativorax TaxID=256821 RepID=A0ABT7C578_9MICO|nr:glutamate--cysteine ligase [Gulosibacter molinativorax]MDJ1370341.1 glutamate--cysteine ligase [Gulosibacter molinativorax]QUY61254.1 Putative glutamate--cysteine ligase 2-2 [Gulosibacter molinativorax]